MIQAPILWYAADWAIRITLIAAVTGAVLSALRIRQARVRHLAWSSVVALSLLMPVVRQWTPRIPLHILPAAPAPLASMPLFGVLPHAPGGAAFAPAANPAMAHFSHAAPLWFVFLALIYFAVGGVLLARLVTGTVLARRLIRESTRSEGRTVNRRCASPVTAGWFRPVVLLPPDWREWPDSQLSAVLSHEAEHARWRDPLMQWLAALNRAILWFHPLSWWLERRLNELAEEACDQAVLRRGADPADYAVWLIAFARSIRQAGGMTRVAGMPMACALLPRLNRLNSVDRFAPAAPGRAAFAVVACGVLSVVIAASAIERSPAAPLKTLVAAVTPESIPVAPAQPAKRTMRAHVKVSPPAPPIPQPAPAAEPPRAAGQFVIYVDLDSIPRPDRQSAIDVAKRSIPVAFSQGMQAAVMVYRGGSIETKQGFTENRGQLLDAIEKLDNDPAADSTGDSSLQGLDFVANNLASGEGGKGILWLAGQSVIVDPARHTEVHKTSASLRDRGIQLRTAAIPAGSL